MRAWQVCGTLGAHKSPQSMYYIGGRCERFAHSPPGARIQTRKANSRWESRKYDSPTTPSELLFLPSTPFLELGVDALLVAQPLPSYCALIQAPQWERAINCWWRLLQLRCSHMKDRDDRFDLVKFQILSRKSVGVRSLIPPPLLLFHVTQSANMANTRAPLSCFLLPKFACSSGNDPSYPIYPL